MTFSDYLKLTFGSKVYRLALSTGCTCPNRDGTAGFGGCTFCSAGGSGDFAESGDILDQLAKAKLRVEGKFPKTPGTERKYIAYFQSFSNTYVNDFSDAGEIGSAVGDTGNSLAGAGNSLAGAAQAVSGTGCSVAGIGIAVAGTAQAVSGTGETLSAAGNSLVAAAQAVSGAGETLSSAAQVVSGAGNSVA
ncbi:MAG: hypothetical protein MJ183_09890, partial [Treponemataceae bacterium]|nr:hypothetical protein [Treponemataceae bacterium]